MQRMALGLLQLGRWWRRRLPPGLRRRGFPEETEDLSSPTAAEPQVLRRDARGRGSRQTPPQSRWMSVAAEETRSQLQQSQGGGR